ncbi:polysaccharide biosynthesis C-terminal domain-containing protein [Burkholderiaceae bacterium]|nr:polysaccharide biosynthesis C-terminal domain-containing protein [Burkholderiaceae bacterium]
MRIIKITNNKNLFSFVSLLLLKSFPFSANIVLASVIIKLGGNENFGIYALIMSVLGFIVIPLAYAFNQIIFRAEIFNKSLVMSNCASVFTISLLLYILYVAISLNYNVGNNINLLLTLPAAILFLILYLLIAIYSGLMRARNALIHAQTLNIWQKPLLLMAVLLFTNDVISLEPTYILFLWLQIGTLVIIACTMYILMNRSKVSNPWSRTENPEGNQIRSIILISLPAIANYWYNDGILLLLNFLTSINDVSHMKKNFVIVSIVAAPLTAINAIFMTKLSRLLIDIYTAKKFFNRVRLMGVSLSIFLVACLFGLEKYITPHFSTNLDWFEYDAVTLILAMMYVASAAFGPVGPLTLALKAERFAFISSCFSVVVSLLAASFLIPKYQSVGAAAAVFLGVILVNSLFFFKIQRHFRLNMTGTKT